MKYVTWINFAESKKGSHAEIPMESSVSYKPIASTTSANVTLILLMVQQCALSKRSPVDWPMLLASRSAMLMSRVVCRRVPMLDKPSAKLESASAKKATKLISTTDVSPALGHLANNLLTTLTVSFAHAIPSALNRSVLSR
jgi:hypothetical protein